jgi:putative membrane protein
MTFALRLAAAFLAGAIALPALAAANPGSRQTREFVQAAGNSDSFEILEAQTVLAQSTNPDVRTFAQHMLEDHSRTRAALADAAARAGLAPPPEGPSTDQAQMLSALQSQRGADFDKTYVKQQALAHRSALTVEQKYATEGDQSAIRQAAAGAVPTISAHLQIADRMKAQMGAD